MLGFRSRGAFRVAAPTEFGPVRVRFLGINERHHSLAICPAAHQRDPGLVHIMVEVDTLDAVGQALDRINAEGFQLSSTLGRHTNDKMVSFYVRAPGDWDIEFGTDGMRVDETYYTAEEITADSYWGHQWVGDDARGDAAMTAEPDVTPVPAASITSWDDEADVVIAGYGVAGAAAAVEAARAGADVLVLERTGSWGGAAAMAGGFIYLGGGTALQKACGFDDSVDNMAAFLNVAMGPGADEDRIADYCAGSVAHFDWLVGCGVPFKAEFFSEPGWEPHGRPGPDVQRRRKLVPRSTQLPRRPRAGMSRRCRTRSRAKPAPATC